MIAPQADVDANGPGPATPAPGAAKSVRDHLRADGSESVEDHDAGTLRRNRKQEPNGGKCDAVVLYLLGGPRKFPARRSAHYMDVTPVAGGGVGLRRSGCEDSPVPLTSAPRLIGAVRCRSSERNAYLPFESGPIRIPP